MERRTVAVSGSNECGSLFLTTAPTLWNIAPWGHSAMKIWRHEDTPLWNCGALRIHRYENMASYGYAAMKTWRHKDTPLWKLGDMRIQRYKNMAKLWANSAMKIWRHEDTGRWKYGLKKIQVFAKIMRHDHTGLRTRVGTESNYNYGSLF